MQRETEQPHSTPWKSINDHPAVATAIFLSVVFGAFWLMLHNVYTARIEMHATRADDLSQRLAEKDAFEERFHNERLAKEKSVIKLEDCNAEFNRLHQNLQDVESANWPQKAATLEIDLNACNEKHALLLARHKDASALHDETTDALRHEIQLLETGNVPVTLPEFDDLLNEHISLKQKHAELKHENSKCIQQSKALQAQVEAERSTNERYRKLAASAIVSNNPSASKETKILIATVRGIGSDSERAKAIKNGLRAMHRRISAADLSSMIAGMRWSGDRRDALVGAAPYLNYPVPRRVIASFTSGLSSGDKSDVLEAFVYHGNQAAGGR